MKIHLPAGHGLVLTTGTEAGVPPFFPGGNIGTLAVHGTLNNLALIGARPIHLAATLTRDAAMAQGDVDRIVAAMVAAARLAGVAFTPGITQVADPGRRDGLSIAATGAGALPPGRHLSAAHARPGDRVLVSGTLGEHGVAVLPGIGSPTFDLPLRSDTAPLHGLVEALLAALPCGAVRSLADPSHGGLRSALQEVARLSSLGVQLDEAAIPISPRVQAACRRLALDPLQLSSRGALLAIVESRWASAALVALRAHPLGRAAAAIGEVIEAAPGRVRLHARSGGGHMPARCPGTPPDRIGRAPTWHSATMPGR